MKEDGRIIIASPYASAQQEFSTRRCAHCGNHFVVVPGSGTLRGFCQMCSGVTCGAQKCLAHFPFEKKLDLIESGKLPIIEL